MVKQNKCLFEFATPYELQDKLFHSKEHEVVI